MAFNIGLNVVEVDGLASPSIVAAPTSVTGFLLRSRRGVPNRPVLVRDFGGFREHFGGYADDAFGAHAVRGFFGNGGSEAWVVRVAAADASAAAVMLVDGTGANTLELTAGRQGREEPGEWADELDVVVESHPRAAAALPASVESSTAEPYGLADGDQLDVTIARGSTPTTVSIAFSAGDFADIGEASASEVADVVNRSTAELRAVVTASRTLMLVRSVSGAGSRLETAGSAAAGLGLGGSSSDAGLVAGATQAVLSNVGGLVPGSAIALETRGHVVAGSAMAAAFTDGSGIDVDPDGAGPVPILFADADFVGGIGAATPGEVVAAINRQAQGFTAAVDDDERLVLLSNRHGAGSSIAVAAPAAAGPDATGDLGLAGTTPVAGARESRALDSVFEAERIVTWTGGTVAAIAPMAARVVSAEFDLAVLREGVELERFESLTMESGLDHYVEAVLNDPRSGSRFVVASDQASAAGPGLDVPVEGRFGLGSTTGGDDGSTPVPTDYIGDPSRRSGLYAFDPVDIQLLVCPDSTAPAVTAACLAYCESRGDAMFIGTAPRGYDRQGTMDYASAFRARKVYGALYAPWIRVVNPLDDLASNPMVWIPPVGHVAGALARISDSRGVWKAPAGDEARLRNALGVEFDMTDTDHTDLVKNGSVNGIRAIPGSGIVIDASRTLSTDSRWLFVNVRRLFNFVKVSLREGLRFVQQEPNTEELRRRVRLNVVTPFLLGLWRQGAFGSDAPEDVITVKCDAENNPPSEVQLGNFRLEVYFHPTSPAETIIIIVGQQDSGATSAEA